MFFYIVSGLIGVFWLVLFIFGVKEEYNRTLVKSFPLIKGSFMAYSGLYILEKLQYPYSFDYDRVMVQIYSKIQSRDEALEVYRLNLATKISFVFIGIVGLLLLHQINVFLTVEQWLLILLVIGALIFGNDIDAKNRMEKREKELLREFPTFVNQLTLLISAGMNVSAAWAFIGQQMLKESELSREIRRSADELMSGMPETIVYEDFAERCGLGSIRKSVTVINQSIKKGSGDLVHSIQLIAVELWAERKAMAIREAEKTSSKILLPMGIILIGLLMVVITPLALQFINLI